MIELLLIQEAPLKESSPNHEVCVQRDTAAFHIDMYNKVVYFSVVNCEGQMVFWKSDIQPIIEAAIEREKPKVKEYGI